MGEPLGDQGCVEFAVLADGTLANHVVAVFNLAGVDVVDLLIGVILTDPFCRTVIHNGPLQCPTLLTNSQTGIVFTASLNSTFPAALLRLGSSRPSCFFSIFSPYPESPEKM